MKDKPSTFESFRQSVGNSVTLKLIFIGTLLLLMNIPLSQIEGLIWERKSYLYDAQSEVQDSWGREQTIAGPELTVPYEVKTFVTNSFGEVSTKVDIHYAHFLPETLQINGNIEDHVLNRGIYEVPVYSAGLNLTGQFLPPKLDEWEESNVTVLWDKASFSLGISDQRSITENVEMFINGKSYQYNTGAEHSGITVNGLSLKIDLTEIPDLLNFSINLNIKGSQNLMFLPLGKETNVSLKSTWKDPSFNGSFLPIDDESKVINEEGFEAKWKIFHLNRSIPQKFTGSFADAYSYSFGVHLFQQVDEYTKTERSVKYAMLFISLTFITFFFIQIINKVKIHPFQFIIVGLALCIFYLLLLSLSEHMGFDKAYIISAAGIVIEIALYVKAIFKSWKLGSLMLVMLSALYLFIYVIIQMATQSLLMGSIGLFVVMGILMYLSRNIDWTFGKGKGQSLE